MKLHNIRSLIVVDGDKFEEKNVDRQDMKPIDEGSFKAEIMARRIEESVPFLSVRAITRYVSERTRNEWAIPVREVIPDGPLVVSCVDNHAARLMLSQHVQTLDNAILISCGNQRSTGDVYRFVRMDGSNITRPIERVHPEIGRGYQRNPADMSCEERAALSGGEQTLAANVMAASLAIVAISQLLPLQGKERSEIREVCKNTEVMFDNHRCSVVPYAWMAAQQSVAQ